MKITITGVDSAKRGIQSEIKLLVARLADEVLVDAKANTPVKTGNARRGWNKKINQIGAVVDNRVPYIERLEAGASKQAPRGIIGPTLQQIKGKI